MRGRLCLITNKTHYYRVNDGGTQGANYADDGASLPIRMHRSAGFDVAGATHVMNRVFVGRREAMRAHGLSANLLQMWLTLYDQGSLNEEVAAASVEAEYEAKIAALERKVGQLTHGD